MTVKLAIVYYSSYGTNHQMATIAMEAAKAAGADVRLLKARETAPAEAVNSQAAWKAHADATADIPEASVEDMEWAEADLSDDVCTERSWWAGNHAQLVLHHGDALGGDCGCSRLHR